MVFLDGYYLLSLDGTGYHPLDVKRFFQKLRRDHPHLPLNESNPELLVNVLEYWEQGVRKKAGSKKMLWERVRSLFREFTVSPMRQIYEALLYG